MILWLDLAIWGNGRGLAQPHHPGRFYWLVDGHTKRGDMYSFFPGYGAQLDSFQWRHPRAQERRLFHGVEYRAFSSERRWGRVKATWSANLTQAMTRGRLDQIERELGVIS